MTSIPVQISGWTTYTINSAAGYTENDVYASGWYNEGSLEIGEVSEGVTVDGNKITMASGSATYEVQLIVGAPKNEG